MDQENESIHHRKEGRENYRFIEHPLIKPGTMQARLYQEAMLGQAVHKHLLCVLPTALGKTNIAIMLAALRLQKLPDSRIMVLAPTRPLVGQHFRTFQKFMNLPEQEMQILTGMIRPAEREELYKEKKIIFATPQCITGDTFVFDLENGPISIEEMFKDIKLKPEKYGDKKGYSSDIKLKLLGLSGSSVKPVKAVKAWKLPNKELFEIKTELKNTIRCTPEHPLLTIDKNAEIKWVKAEDLTIENHVGMIKRYSIKERRIDFYKCLKGEKIRVCNRNLINEILKNLKKNKVDNLSKYTRYKWNTMPFDIFIGLYKKCNKSLPGELLVTDWTAKSKPIRIRRHLTPKIAYILGAFIGDGHIGNRYGHGGDVVFSDLDRPTISNKIKCLVNETFGILPKEERRKGLVYHSSALATVLNCMGINRGNKSKIARIPKLVFYQDNEYAANLLSGLFNADGNASKHMITFSTVSKGLAQDIKWLLLKLGIVASIHKREKSESRIRDKPIKGSVLYNIIISGRKQIEEFISLCKPDKNKCNLVLSSLKTSKSPYTRSRDILPIEDALRKAYMEHKSSGGKPIKGQWESISCYKSSYKISDFLKKLKSRKARDIENILSLPIRWVKIRSIKKIKKKSWVYDFTIKDDHNFIANYLINHNTVQKDLENGRLSLKDFSLLVADEAHHSVGRYAYPYVVRHYLEEADNPRILGLTASPGGTGEKIKEICTNLGIDAVEIRTETDDDVLPYIKEKELDWVYVDLPESFMKIKLLIESVFNKRIASLRKMGYIHKRFASKRDLLGLQQGFSKSIREGNNKAFGGMTYTVQAIKLEHALGLLETQGVNVLERYWSKLRKEPTRTARQLLANKDVSSAMLLTQELVHSGGSHPKIAKLCSIVGEQMVRKKDSRIIIFANFRESVKQIYSVLDRIENVNPVMLVGQKEGLSQKEQMDVIHRYNEGEYNCLITTSIGEEGLDIPAMDIAVFYEPVPSEIRSIQRRGRVGRQKIGRVVVLIARGTRDEAYRWSAMNKERRMHRTLHGMKKNGLSGPPKQQTVEHF